MVGIAVKEGYIIVIIIIIYEIAPIKAFQFVRLVYLFIYLFIFYIHMRPDLSYDGWPRTIPKKASIGPMFFLATWLCAWRGYLASSLTLSHFYQPIYTVLTFRNLLLTFTHPYFTLPISLYASYKLYNLTPI